MVYQAKHKSISKKRWKILTSKQMFQRLPISLAQVKAGSISEKLLDEIRKITYVLYPAKQNNKKSI